MWLASVVIKLVKYTSIFSVPCLGHCYVCHLSKWCQNLLGKNISSRICLYFGHRDLKAVAAEAAPLDTDISHSSALPSCLLQVRLMLLILSHSALK